MVLRTRCMSPVSPDGAPSPLSPRDDLEDREHPRPALHEPQARRPRRPGTLDGAAPLEPRHRECARSEAPSSGCPCTERGERNRGPQERQQQEAHHNARVYARPGGPASDERIAPTTTRVHQWWSVRRGLRSG